VPEQRYVVVRCDYPWDREVDDREMWSIWDNKERCSVPGSKSNVRHNAFRSCDRLNQIDKQEAKEKQS